MLKNYAYSSLGPEFCGDPARSPASTSLFLFMACRALLVTTHHILIMINVLIGKTPKKGAKSIAKPKIYINTRSGICSLNLLYQPEVRRKTQRTADKIVSKKRKSTRSIRSIKILKNLYQKAPDNTIIRIQVLLCLFYHKSGHILLLFYYIVNLVHF